jgi:hypothetical protein
MRPGPQEAATRCMGVATTRCMGTETEEQRGGAPEKTEEFTRTSSPAEGTKCPFFEEPEQKKGTLTNPTELCVAEEPDAAAHESKEKAEQ